MDVNFNENVYIKAHFLHPLIKNLPFLLGLGGILFSIVIVEGVQYFKSFIHANGSYFLTNEIYKNKKFDNLFSFF